ncbi:MAG: DUF6512 family protein [Dehalococcoidales bacterium]|jgi:hypothetical protein|nr:DUF6512 family protein [Dehalococcoidales bacterium]
MDTRVRGYVFQWALLGILGVAVIATLWHFLFFLTAEFAVIGAIVPVNDSVWEHFKVILYPMLLFAIIEYRYIGYHVNNYITAKTITIFLILLIIGAVFYTYFYVAGKQIAAADISIFVGALIIGQMVGAWVMTFDPLPRYFNFVAIGLLVALAIVLIVFTYNPLHVRIFLDSTAGIYGLP